MEVAQVIVSKKKTMRLILNKGYPDIYIFLLHEKVVALTNDCFKEIYNSNDTDNDNNYYFLHL